MPCYDKTLAAIQTELDKCRVALNQPRPKLVLVVEDETDVRDLLRVSLHAAGFVSVEKSTLREALEYLSDNKPDLVVLDLRLPDSWGEHTIRAIRIAVGDTPVVIYSGTADRSVKVMHGSPVIRKGDAFSLLFDALVVSMRRNRHPLLGGVSS